MEKHKLNKPLKVFFFFFLINWEFWSGQYEEAGEEFLLQPYGSHERVDLTQLPHTDYTLKAKRCQERCVARNDVLISESGMYAGENANSM